MFVRGNGKNTQNFDIQRVLVLSFLNSWLTQVNPSIYKNNPRRATRWVFVYGYIER